jgi:hypothetical protein
VRRNILTLLALLALTVASVLIAGCDLSSPTGPPGPTGTLTGRLQAVGGPSDASPQPLGGQITLHGSNGHITAITVGVNGRFSAPVTVGKYTVTGQSPQYESGAGKCHASGPVTVSKGVTTSVEVDCQEK